MYKADRTFTNYVHKHLALPIIYKQLLWSKVKLKQVTLNI
jgi:hypothetical protein